MTKGEDGVDHSASSGDVVSDEEESKVSSIFNFLLNLSCLALTFALRSFLLLRIFFDLSANFRDCEEGFFCRGAFSSSSPASSSVHGGLRQGRKKPGRAAAPKRGSSSSPWREVDGSDEEGGGGSWRRKAVGKIG